MTTINTAACEADKIGMGEFTFCRNGREFRVIALTAPDAVAAMESWLADETAAEPVGEMPSLFEQ